MPFSSLTDPADLARAQGALDAAWDRVRPLAEEVSERDRTRLAYIVESNALVAVDEDDLAQRAWIGSGKNDRQVRNVSGR